MADKPQAPRMSPAIVLCAAIYAGVGVSLLLWSPWAGWGLIAVAALVWLIGAIYMALEG